jgi:hypothetical protein
MAREKRTASTTAPANPRSVKNARKNKDRVDTVAQLNDEMQHVDVINKDIEMATHLNILMATSSYLSSRETHLHN